MVLKQHKHLRHLINFFFIFKLYYFKFISYEKIIKILFAYKFIKKKLEKNFIVEFVVF